jgi:hypothetical protein
MAENRDELLRHYARMHDELLGAMHGLSDVQMTDPSIDGWSVKDHLAHLAQWDDIRAAEVTRISAGYDSTWHMAGNQDDVFNALGYELRRNLPLDQVRWEFATAHQRLLDAVAAATQRGLDPSLYGEASLLTTHASEHAGWIRRWREQRAI